MLLHFFKRITFNVLPGRGLGRQARVQPGLFAGRPPWPAVAAFSEGLTRPQHRALRFLLPRAPHGLPLQCWAAWCCSTRHCALLRAPPRAIKSLQPERLARTSPAAARRETPGRAGTPRTDHIPPRPRPPHAPRVTCPDWEVSSSPSSGLPEKTRKCPAAGAGPSGRAVRAFVPPAGGLPRRRHSQYVSPRPPALPAPALACHALPFVAGSRLPLGYRAGSGGGGASPVALRTQEARPGGAELREDLGRPRGWGGPGCGPGSLWAPARAVRERLGPGCGRPVSGYGLGPGACPVSAVPGFPGRG